MPKKKKSEKKEPTVVRACTELENAQIRAELATVAAIVAEQKLQLQDALAKRDAVVSRIAGPNKLRDVKDKPGHFELIDA